MTDEYRNTEARLPAVPEGFKLRSEVSGTDVQRVAALVSAAGNFSRAEIDLACELIEERLAKGAASGYEFIFLEADTDLAGYTCYGPIPATDRRFDLYWIAVHPGQQGRGLGRWLIARTEHEVRRRGGIKVYIETSSRDNYAAARALYQRCDYRLDAQIRDYYAAGDANCIFSKPLTSV